MRQRPQRPYRGRKRVQMENSEATAVERDSTYTTYISFIIVFEADEWLITCVLTEH